MVDDQPELAELIRTVLAEDGHSVETVHGGRAALERLAQHTYDLIVCDLHMPDRDGPAVYRALARRPPPRPCVVFVTGYAEAQQGGKVWRIVFRRRLREPMPGAFRQRRTQTRGGI